MKTSTIKFGNNKGNRRIWLESGTLIKYGFTRGTPIRVTYYNHDKVIVIATVTGQTSAHTVAGRVRKGRAISIIDINNADVTAIVGAALTGKVTYEQNVITIEVSK